MLTLFRLKKETFCRNTRLFYKQRRWWLLNKLPRFKGPLDLPMLGGNAKESTYSARTGRVHYVPLLSRSHSKGSSCQMWKPFATIDSVTYRGIYLHYFSMNIFHRFSIGLFIKIDFSVDDYIFQICFSGFVLLPVSACFVRSAPKFTETISRRV